VPEKECYKEKQDQIVNDIKNYERKQTEYVRRRKRELENRRSTLIQRSERDMKML
jgi:hypothetical protein